MNKNSYVRIKFGLLKPPRPLSAYKFKPEIGRKTSTFSLGGGFSSVVTKRFPTSLSQKHDKTPRIVDIQFREVLNGPRHQEDIKEEFKIYSKVYQHYKLIGSTRKTQRIKVRKASRNDTHRRVVSEKINTGSAIAFDAILDMSK